MSRTVSAQKKKRLLHEYKNNKVQKKFLHSYYEKYMNNRNYHGA